MFLEERDCEHYCKHSECVPHEFEKDRFARVLEVIKDCSKVFVALIGEKPAQELEQYKIEPVVYNGMIDELQF